MMASPLRPPRVLIASSTEGLRYATALQDGLKPDVRAELWNEGILAPGTFAIDSLAAPRTSFDGAIVVATADDRVVARKHQSSAPRDNLIFEFGLFVALYGRRRALLLVEDESGIKLPSDVDGLTYIPFSTDPDPAVGVGEAVRQVRSAAGSWPSEPLDSDARGRMERLLRLSMNEFQHRGILSRDFGLHLYLADERWEPVRLVRAARVRATPMAPKQRQFVRGEGVVGTCWGLGEPSFCDFTVEPIASATRDTWRSLSAGERFGMSWEMVEEGRRRYKAVAAFPIQGFSESSPFAGCIALNLSRRATEDPSVLDGAEAEHVLSVCAETIAAALGLT